MPLNFQPKYDKIVELLLYLAHARPDADKYQAVKFFYLADREHLARHGRPITNETYFALWYGPVASHALDLLEGDQFVLKKFGVEQLPFKTEVGKTKTGKDTIYIREPLRDVNFDLFSKSDIRVFDEIIDKYGSATFDELMNLTHEHRAYRDAWDTRRGGKNRAPMIYDDMIENEDRKSVIVKDIGPISDRV